MKPTYCGDWDRCWTREGDHLVLKQDGRQLYCVTLSEAQTPAQILDWIVQVSKKAFGTDEVVGGLVRALDGILDMQGRVCSWGENQTARTAEGSF